MDLTTFAIGFLLGIVIHIVFPDRKYDILIIDNDNIRDEFILQKKLVYLLELMENQDRLDNELFLKGFITVQNSEESSNNLNSNLNLNTPLDSLKNKYESIAKESSQSGLKSKRSADEFAAFIKYIQDCYKKGLRKFPASNSLRLNYLLFSIKYLKNPTISLLIIKQIDKSTLTFEEKFILFKYSRTVEERMLMQNAHVMRLDINFEITYKRNKIKCK
jgi:hypothetical protein